jgi:hypothetical protein
VVRYIANQALLDDGRVITFGKDGLAAPASNSDTIFDADVEAGQLPSIGGYRLAQSVRVESRQVGAVLTRTFLSLHRSKSASVVTLNRTPAQPSCPSRVMLRFKGRIDGIGFLPSPDTAGGTVTLVHVMPGETVVRTMAWEPGAARVQARGC